MHPQSSHRCLYGIYKPPRSARNRRIAGNIGGHKIWQICHKKHLAVSKFGRFDPQDRRRHKKAVGVVNGQGEEDFPQASWAATSPRRSCSQHAALPSTSADFSLLAVVLGTVKFIVTQAGPFSAVYLPIFALSSGA